MNLSTMRTAVRTKCSLDVNDASLDNTALNALINEAVHTFETEADWPWLEAFEDLSVTTGNSTKAPAATYLRTISLFDTASDMPLEEKEIEFLDRLTAAQGKPRFYGYFAGSLEFRPKADGAYTLRHRYLRFEPDLVADGDTPIAYTAWHPAIVEYACALVYRRLQDTQRAAQYVESYKMWVDKAKKRSNLSTPDQGGGIGGDR